MFSPVPGQERHGNTLEGPGQDGIGWFPEGCRDPDLFDVGESRHLVEAASTDDSHLCGGSFPCRRRFFGYLGCRFRGVLL